MYTVYGWTIFDKWYIGSTKNYKQRKAAHKTKLKHGTHPTLWKHDLRNTLDMSKLEWKIFGEDLSEEEAEKLENELIKKYDAIDNGFSYHGGRYGAMGNKFHPERDEDYYADLIFMLYNSDDCLCDGCIIWDKCDIIEDDAILLT